MNPVRRMNPVVRRNRGGPSATKRLRPAGRRIKCELDLTLIRRKKLTTPQNLIRHEGVALCDIVNLRMMNERIVMRWMKMESPSVNMCGAKGKM